MKYLFVCLVFLYPSFLSADLVSGTWSVNPQLSEEKHRDMKDVHYIFSKDNTVASIIKTGNKKPISVGKCKIFSQGKDETNGYGYYAVFEEKEGERKKEFTKRIKTIVAKLEDYKFEPKNIKLVGFFNPKEKQGEGDWEFGIVALVKYDWEKNKDKVFTPEQMPSDLLFIGGDNPKNDGVWVAESDPMRAKPEPWGTRKAGSPPSPSEPIDAPPEPIDPSPSK